MKKKVSIPDVILFDCFETLVENELSNWKLLFKKIVKENNWNIKSSEFWKIWKEEEVLFRKNRTNMCNFAASPKFKSYEKAWEECFEKVLPKLGVIGNSKKLSRKCVINMSKNIAYKDTPEYLKKLSNYCKIGVISNADNDFLYPVLEKIEFEFDYILSSETAKCYKPDPTIFKQLLVNYDLDPSKCWYVGDKEFDDVLGSSSVGMEPFLINRSVYNDIYEEKKITCISNLTQLYELIK